MHLVTATVYGFEMLPQRLAVCSAGRGLDWSWAPEQRQYPADVSELELVVQPVHVREHVLV